MKMSNKYHWLNDKSREFLSRGYITSGITAEERIRHIAETAEKYLNIEGFADKFEDYMARGWFSLASPIWANFGEPTGLPISCNGQYVGDSMHEILKNQAETGIMTKNGAGTSAYFGDIRGRGSLINGGFKSYGAVHFMKLWETTINIVSQSKVRRGAFAAYYPIDGPDILEFLDIRKDGNDIQNLYFGVTITDEWMKSLRTDEQKQAVWCKVLKKRYETGMPYIFWTDTVNDNAPQVYKDKKMKIHGSNLCTEICNSASEKDSFVCDLSSMNLLYYYDWKDTDAIEVLTYFLDAVMSDYIAKTKDIPFMEKAHHFAVTQRSLGVGVLGWHSLLQSLMIPFESMEAKRLNVEIWKLIQKKTIKASKEMAEIYGEPELLKGYGMRNVCLQAVAPTTSSSFILGQVSPGVEPLDCNYFMKDLAHAKDTYKNPHLKEILSKYGKDTTEVWNTIRDHGGSVMTLDFLNDTEKSVFKTFGEISQAEIVIQAAQRQKFIDQSQSINLMIHPETHPKEVSELLIYAWECGLKTLYYQLGTNPAQDLARSILTCVSCEA
jgi:ribonucleoside-diphosphate reductase alpha chain